jgi:hypothetical protein
MKAYKHLVKHALAQGHTISVWDGEEWQVSHSSKYQKIIEAIESVEEAQIKVRMQAHGNLLGVANISAYGLEDDETVTDHNLSQFMQEWEEIYEQAQNL